jgi:CheY-like chemotaxis protein
MPIVETNTGPDSADREDRFLLVVDSDVNNLFYTSMLLQRLNYRISTAKTAREALETATISTPSVIITALGLTDMRGLELVQQLKQNPGTADIPFILLTQRGDLLAEKHSRELGAIECLSQPISPELLYRAVQTAVEATPRANIRLRTRLLVTVNAKPLECGDGACISELSERGLFLRTRSPASAKTRLSLQFDLNGRLIAAEATVLYNYRAGGGSDHEPGMGLEFVRIAPIDREFIQQFIRAQLTRGIAPMDT